MTHLTKRRFTTSKAQLDQHRIESAAERPTEVGELEPHDAPLCEGDDGDAKADYFATAVCTLAIAFAVCVSIHFA